MSTRVAINGLGRIGRAILKLTIDEPALELTAVNDLADIENLAYLLRFDTVYGRYSKSVAVDGDKLVVGGREVRTLTQRDPAGLPWKSSRREIPGWGPQNQVRAASPLATGRSVRCHNRSKAGSANLAG